MSAKYYEQLVEVLEPIIIKDLIIYVIFPIIPKTYIPSEEFRLSFININNYVKTKSIFINQYNWYDYLDLLRTYKYFENSIFIGNFNEYSFKITNLTGAVLTGAKFPIGYEKIII